MKYLTLALLALCSTAKACDTSFLPFQDEKHPERYHMNLGTPPIACQGPNAHFSIYYFDDENRIEAMFEVKSIRIDDRGIYFNKSDIISKKICKK